MKYFFLISFSLLGCLPTLFAQTVAFARVNQVNLNLRGNPVVVGQVTITPPANGKVILRFDGHCLSSEGDRIILAASETNLWGPNDGNVQVQAASADVNSNTFSHTRSFGVDGGEPTTFYAVAQNAEKMNGTGTATIYGSLTAEWFPTILTPETPFAVHKGFYYENIFVEGAPTALNSINIEAPVSGKVLVRFDGKCVSSYGDLMFFAASDTPDWTNYDGSTSNEVIDDELNHFSFAHVRSYDVQPGSHTFYAVTENYFETYGNGFASLYGSLTVQFYPDAAPTSPIFIPISTPLGVNISGPPVSVGQISLDAPASGKLELNFTGTCIGSHGDQIRLAASDELNWGPEDGNITFEPYSTDLNRVSFSHTRVYDITPGAHDFYGIVQNYEEFEGAGLAVIYGSLTARYFPDKSSAVAEPSSFQPFSLSPNPVSSELQIDFPELSREAFSLSITDVNGKTLNIFQKSALDGSEHLNLSVAALPSGIYFVKLTNATGTAVKQFVRK